MKFVATEFRDDGQYGVQLEADNWAEAARVCDREGWRLDGELMAIIPYEMSTEDVAGIVAQLNRGGLN